MRRFIVGSRGARIFLSGLPVFRYRAIAAGLLLLVAIISVPPAESQLQTDAAVEDAFYRCLREQFKSTRRDMSDHTRAFDPDSGRNFVYDKDKGAWIDAKTGECICPKCQPPSTATTPPTPPTEKVNKVSYELGLGYQHTRADEETEKFSLNGWNATLKVNLTDRLGIVADVSDARGSQNSVDLRRELFLIGPEFSTHSNDKTTLFAHPLIGVVYDKTSFGGFSDSNHALALALGCGVQYRVNTGASLRVQADYVPTHFGGDWQHNLRLSAGVVFGFGRK